MVLMVMVCRPGWLSKGFGGSGFFFFGHERGFGGLAVFEEFCKLGMLLHEGGVALPKRLQRVAVERGAQRVGEVRVHRVLQQIERGLQCLRRADVTRRDGRFEADEAAGVVG